MLAKIADILRFGFRLKFRQIDITFELANTFSILKYL